MINLITFLSDITDSGVHSDTYKKFSDVPTDIDSTVSLSVSSKVDSETAIEKLIEMLDAVNEIFVVSEFSLHVSESTHTASVTFYYK